MGVTPQEMRDWALEIGKAQESIDRLPEHAWQSLASTWSELKPRASSDAMFFDGDTPALVSCVVGYVDALGTKQAMKHLDDVELNRQRDLVTAARSWFDDHFEYEAMLTFSDNSVVAAPVYPVDVPTDPSSVVGQIVAGLGALQLEQLLMGGRLYRGGVALGPVFAEPNFITGLGLVDAVLLEESVADVPRIVLSDKCRDLLLATYVLDTGAEDGLLLLDGDGHAFISYLRLMDDLSEGSAYEYTELMERHRQQVQSRLSEAENDRVRRKLVWLVQYHNFFCRLSGLEEYAVDGLTEAELAAPRSFKTVTEVLGLGA